MPAGQEQFELYGSDNIGLTKLGNEVVSYKKAATAKDYTPWAFNIKDPEGKHLQELPPCTFGQPIIEYFNDPTVRKLLHIPINPNARAWDLCTNGIEYT